MARGARSRFWSSTSIVLPSSPSASQMFQHVSMMTRFFQICALCASCASPDTSLRSGARSSLFWARHLSILLQYFVVLRVCFQDIMGRFTSLCTSVHPRLSGGDSPEFYTVSLGKQVLLHSSPSGISTCSSVLGFVSLCPFFLSC